MSVLTIIPIPSEKAYAQSLQNIYLFSVPLTANKQQIAEAVETQYGVTVTGVKTLVQNGKTVAFSRGKRARPGTTKRRDAKKAYVSLADGDSIKVFDAPEEKTEGGDK
jgi:large subunit ribosomal protein L23